MIKLGEVRANEEKAERITAQDVLAWMRNYKENKERVAELQKEYLDMVGSKLSAGYGIEATMPKGNDGHSDPVASDAIHKERKCAELDILEHHVRFIEHRWHRIEDEKHARVFQLRIEGYDIDEIGYALTRSKRYVHRYLKDCAELILG